MHRERQIQTQGGSINVIDSGGSGSPIVLLHGSAASVAAFGRQFDSPLIQQFRLIAFDLPGHGESANASDPASAYSIQGLTRTTVEVLQGLGIARAVFFGWSLGGHIAIELMAQTDLVAGLMLTGTPPIAPGLLGLLRGFHLSTDMLLTSKPAYTRADAERMVRLSFGDAHPPGMVDATLRSDGRLRAAVSKSFLHGHGMGDHRSAVQSATVPIAFAEGQHDPFVRTGYAASLDIPALWGRRIFTDAGHSPFWQSPETFNALLQRFAVDVATGYSRPASPDRAQQIPRQQAGR